MQVTLFYSYDIVISKEAAEIPAPTNVTAGPTTTTADVAWTEAGDATQWNLRYREYIDPDKANRFWDFEDIDQLSDWFIIDNDEDGFNWEYASSRYTAHSGSGVLVSASYDSDAKEALTPDNWLITPVVPLGGKVSFWACGQDASYSAEVFAVYVCIGGDDSLDEVYAVSDEITATGDMTQYEFDLSDFEGMEGRIAIRHYNVTDMFYLNIDDVKVEIPGGIDMPEWNVVDGLSESEYTIEDLTPETTYEVQIQTYGDDAISDWTESTIFTTLAAPVTVTISADATDGDYNYATLYYSNKNLSVPEGIKAYTATAANGEITLNEIGDAIPAGLAVVLKTEAKLSEATDFEFGVVDEAEAVDAENMLKGTDEATTISDAGYKYYMLSLNGESEPESIGFYFDKDSNGGTQIKNGAHKAYLAVPEAAAAKGYPFGGDATGIEGLNVNDNVNVNVNEVYDLQGRKVSGKNLPKGIYIVNGKKVVK